MKVITLGITGSMLAATAYRVLSTEPHRDPVRVARLLCPFY